jgi:Anaphase-promoting complex sub unit 1 C-terminal domain
MQALCDRAVLFVKKRARALAYSDDPTGVRSLLSSLFDSARSMASMPASGDTLTDASQNLQRMCWTFSSDPFVASFALAMCQTPAEQQLQTGLAQDAAVALRTRLQRALTDCVMHEQANLLPFRLQLICLFHVCADTRACEPDACFTALLCQNQHRFTAHKPLAVNHTQAVLHCSRVVWTT